jgi:hypothetical protein
MSNSRKNLALNNQNEVISSYYSNIKVTENKSNCKKKNNNYQRKQKNKIETIRL